ncbi:Rne/Rng family ribonuclease [Acuticoccus kandeliae]|uniref:Rne/Rng family ribonuclease n=1 Tax=Acuticoccus kandeliae TaxID=2073160 RepID=UPI000D3ED0AE|nr:ribonuclease E/G [Acuticoccus kandeliae]
MSNKMLIDAIHPEETRVVVVRDKRVEDFDFEAASKKPLRGNIYLAKVTRVEPSLQAAFIEYGGNRHGFLAFSEIHPDYYQIPAADRAALLEAEREDEADEPAPKEKRRRRSQRNKSRGEATSARAEPAAAPAAEAASEGDEPEIEAAAEADAPETDAPVSEAAAAPEAPEAPAGFDVSDEADNADAPPMLARAIEQVEATMAADLDAAFDNPIRDAEMIEPAEPEAPAEAAAPSEAETADAAPAEEATAAAETPAEDAAETTEDDTPPAPRRRRTRTPRTPRTKKAADGLADPQVSDDEDSDDDSDDDEEANTVTSLGNSDVMEEIPERRRSSQPRRTYKIQEVIKRRQILLVQVVKEERGTKGAALTTYLSLAGRYSVLMPNTDRGGGVSRKITDSADRKRLKSLVAELDVPEGMGIILRTAGASRTKTEIRRDFEYLLRLWESVRDLTLKSIAPELVYEEGNLVKRAIRDLYNKEIDEILVSGESAYREAKDFMRMLMPSHAKNVKPYREATPIFTSYGIEPQLDAMFSPQVTLPSKGYIVINPTEALVSIDVNSGRSTKEHSIEDTALKTNLEAADEVARQLRLRDLAGLIVIDFIDMDEKRHNRAVEKRLKDALKLDRSRIQVGRISPFGLLEMSRQRIRQGMVETSMVPCSACGGTGHVRSTQSVALYCLRTLEEFLLKQSDHHVTIKTSASVALYILNQKRSHLRDLESRFGLEIGVDADEALGGQHMEIVTGRIVERTPEDAAPPTTQVVPDAVILDEEDEDVVDDIAEAAEEKEAATASEPNGERSSRRRRRRRRRGGGNGDDTRAADNGAPVARDEMGAEDDEPGDESDTETAEAAEASDEAMDADGDNGDGSDDDRRGRRRRGRRGGRRHRREGEEFAQSDAEGGDEGETVEAAGSVLEVEITEPQSTEPANDEPESVESETVEVEATPAELTEAPETAEVAPAEAEIEAAPAEAAEEAAEEAAPNGEAEEEVTAAAEPVAEEAPAPQAPKSDEPPAKPRAGWWQRRSFF